jgi:acyl carrier protein
MSQTVRNIVFAELQRTRQIPGDSESARLTCDYLQAGVIDSLGLIDLVTRLESELGIAFTSDEFEDPRFRTVGGLIDIIEHKRQSAPR